MPCRFVAIMGVLFTLTSGCTSQDAYTATVSLKQQAERAERAVYSEVHYVAAAGSGAEDEPIEPPHDPAEPEDDGEPVDYPDASFEQRVREAQTFSDDSPLCGNGELDLAELCDPLITEGEGACPERCDPLPGCPAEELVVDGCATHCKPLAPAPESCFSGR